MNNVINEEQKIWSSLEVNQWRGVTDIMKITNVGYYRTLSILQEFVKQGMVEMAKKGKWDRYRKIRVVFDEATKIPINKTIETRIG